MSARFIAKVAGGSVLAVGLTMVVPAIAFADPTAAVVPSTGLADGAVVQVSGAGLNPGTGYRVGECAQLLVGEFVCNNVTKVDAIADANGALSVPLKVNSVFEGIRFDGTSAGTVDCKVVVACAAGMSDAAGGGTGAMISFK